MARRRSRPPDLRVVGNGEGIFALLSALCGLVAVAIWAWRQHQENTWYRIKPIPDLPTFEELQARREGAQRAYDDACLEWDIRKEWLRSKLRLAGSYLLFLVSFRWFGYLGDLTQAIIFGLIASVPIVLFLLRYFGRS
jgi:hypothetical protein